LKDLSHLQAHVENHVGLAQVVNADRPWIRATMTGIKHDRVAPLGNRRKIAQFWNGTARQLEGRRRKGAPTGTLGPLQTALTDGTETAHTGPKVHGPAVDVGAHQLDLTRVEPGTGLKLDHQAGGVVGGATDADLTDRTVARQGSRALGCPGQIHPDARPHPGTALLKKGLKPRGRRRP